MLEERPPFPSTSKKAAATFQTAGSSKIISISESSLEKAHLLLQDPSSFAENPQLSTCAKNPVAAFHTAGSTEIIQVSEFGLQRAQDLLLGHKHVTSSQLSWKEGAADSTGLAEFQTADLKKCIPISHSSPQRSNQLFSERDFSSSNVDNSFKASNNDSTLTGSEPPAIFQPAGSKKTIRVSDDNLQKADQLLREPPALLDSNDADKQTPAVTFQTTGSSTTIYVSEDSLQRADPIFRQASTLSGSNDGVQLPSENKTIIAAVHPVGSSKSFPVSESSVATVRQILRNNDTTSKIPFGHDWVPNAQNAEETVVAFQTANSNTATEVLGTSIRREQLLLQDSVSAYVENGAILSPLRSISPSSSAATQSMIANNPLVAAIRTAGSGKTLEVSDENFERAKALLEESSLETDPANNDAVSHLLTESISPLSAFRMAGSGKTLEISDENFERAETFLQESSLETHSADNDAVSHPLTQRSPPLIAFRTAGFETTLDVSDETHEMAETLLQELSQPGTASLVTATLAPNTRTAQADKVIPSKIGTVAISTLVGGTPSQSRTGSFETPSSAAGVTKTSCAASNHVKETSKNGPRQLANGVIYVDAGNTEVTVKTTASTRIMGHAFSPSDCSQTEAIGKRLREPLNRSALVPITPLPTVSTPHNQVVRWGSIRRVTIGITPSAAGTTNYPDGGDSPSSPQTLVVRSTKRKELGSIGIHDTPQHSMIQNKKAKVTMSMTPHHRKRSESSKKDSMTPVPINFTADAETRESLSPWPNSDFPMDLEAVPTSAAKVKPSVTPKDAIHFGELTNNPRECWNDGVKETTLMVNSQNATEVRFDSQTSLPVAFSHSLDRHTGYYIGSISDIRESLAKKGCDANLLKDNWISNHVRWVIWKQASYERSFSRFLGGRYLNYDSVVEDLKKRFEKEVIEGRRPAIRKVLNRDAAANCMMILAVARVLSSKQSARARPCNSESTAHGRIELTDGWYSIQAILDSKLSEFVHRGLIKVGSKLLISNAQLIGAEEGLDPLDECYNPSDLGCKVGLRLTANASRLAKWDARLGFVKLPLPVAPNGMLLVKNISDIIPGGGNIPIMQLVVSRRYPLLYYEKNQTANDNNLRGPILTEAEEDIRRMQFERRKMGAVEKLSESFEKEIEKVREGKAPATQKSLSECY